MKAIWLSYILITLGVLSLLNNAACPPIIPRFVEQVQEDNILVITVEEVSVPNYSPGAMLLLGGGLTYWAIKSAKLKKRRRR